MIERIRNLFPKFSRGLAILSKRGRRIDSRSGLEARTSLLQQWYRGYRDSKPTYAFVVFSKDRPMQLHALLCSYMKTARSEANIVVLWYGSNDAFAEGYRQCEFLHARNTYLRFVRQLDDTSFWDDLQHILESISETRLAFLVDDIIFIREFDLRDFNRIDPRQCVPSLRLGKNIVYSYTMNRGQSLPSSLKEDGDFLKWNWLGSDIDWAYPLSVDGNLSSKRNDSFGANVDIS